VCIIATERKIASRRRFWRIALFVLVVLPLLSEIVVLSAWAIADLSGCPVDAPPGDAAIDSAGGPSVDSEAPPDPWMVAEGLAPAPGSVVGAPGRVCAIGPQVSSIIRHALEAGFFVGDVFSSGMVVLWLAVCYVAITRGWTRFLSRLTLAFFVSLIFAIVPYFGPMISIGHLVNPNCQPNDAGVGACFMYGGEVGSVVHDNMVLASQGLFGAAIALGVFSLYLLILLISAFASRRGAARSA
jgi:hypothetical protein